MAIRFAACLVIVAAGVAIVGCNSHVLPRNDPADLPLALQNIPEGATPVHSWKVAHRKLYTYWDIQQAWIEASAHFPKAWRRPGDGFWRVKAENGEGKPLPFLGVIVRYTNKNGTELAMVVPAVDLDKIPDGLYIVIEPNVTLKDGRIVKIQPEACVVEVRDHSFKPFQFKLPLVPDKETPLTPAPKLLPEEPEGTPIPVGSLFMGCGRPCLLQWVLVGQSPTADSVSPRLTHSHVQHRVR